MYSFRELIGKKVFSGANEEVGVVEGLNITLPEHHVYLEIGGMKMLEIRGQYHEFIPIKDVEKFNGGVFLYKNFSSLGEMIKKVHMESNESYNAETLIGMGVISSDNKEVGTIADIIISNERMKPFYVLEGPKIEGIRGSRRELLPFLTVESIRFFVKIDVSFDYLAQRLKQYPTLET